MRASTRSKKARMAWRGPSCCAASAAAAKDSCVIVNMPSLPNNRPLYGAEEQGIFISDTSDENRHFSFKLRIFNVT